jgi:hypothetical protein
MNYLCERTLTLIGYSSFDICNFYRRFVSKRSFVDWKNKSKGGKGISEKAAMIKVSQ